MRFYWVSFTFLLAIAIAGCTSSETADGAVRTPAVDDSPIDGGHPSPIPVASDVSAQRAFERVLNGNVDATRAAGESDFSFAMRNLDAELSRFREAGVEFWRNHPEDPRRFEWLEMTINAPPSYAADPFEWVAAIQSLGPDTYVVDSKALLAWERSFESMREEFWNAPEVSELQRRSFRSAELRQQMLDLRRASDSERDKFDANAFLAEFVEFAERFPEASGRREAYLWDFGVVLRLALGRNDTINVDRERTLKFARQLAELDSEVAQFYANDIIEQDGRFTFHSFFTSHKRVEESIRTNEALSLHRPATPEQISDRVLDYILYSIPLFPGLHQDESRGASAAFLIDTYRDGLRFLNAGDRYWDSMESNERLRWVLLAESQKRPWFFPKSLSAYFWRPRSERGSSWSLDEEATKSWLGLIDSRATELLDSHALSEEDETRLIVLRGNLSFRESRTLWMHAGNRDASDELVTYLASLAEGVMERPNDEMLSEAMASLLSGVYRHRDSLGLSETEVRALAAEFNEVQDFAFQDTVASILSAVKLEPGAEISMQAPTLDGDNTVGLEMLRGNIVLVDHWDTNCAPCIAAFPEIHAIYQEYQDQGFEVVSIAYDGESQRENVKRIKTRMGLTWETLNGEGLWPAVAARYGYTGVPQYMLLDRKGRWIAGTAEMGNGANLRALLDEMLANEKAGYYDRQPAMWRISDDDTTVYLYGTLHSVKNHFNWWSEEAQAALERSSTIYVEVTENTPKDEQQRVLQTYTRNPEGVVLSDFLTKAQETEVRAAADEVGLTWQKLSNFTPGFAGNELVSAQLEQDGVEPNKTTDSMIVAKAKEHGLELRAFASFERQIRYLAEMSAEGQVAWLMDSLERDDPDSFDRLFQAWYWGDTQALEAEAISGQKEKLPEAYEVLIMGRNSEWAAEIDRVLDEETGSVFVAVGAGHLVGPDSLQSMLEKEGHSAVRVH